MLARTWRRKSCSITRDANGFLGVCVDSVCAVFAGTLGEGSKEDEYGVEGMPTTFGSERRAERRLIWSSVNWETVMRSWSDSRAQIARAV
jgi:hypothetical protein